MNAHVFVAQAQCGYVDMLLSRGERDGALDLGGKRSTGPSDWDCRDWSPRPQIWKVEHMPRAVACSSLAGQAAGTSTACPSSARPVGAALHQAHRAEDSEPRGGPQSETSAGSWWSSRPV